ncbi:DNA polymerase III subunit delta' [Thiohalophilus sp.]|uniref:DNA polymerase III subunit delta' n=1 Tax=Thiohalophilus sp. TaxID=3028392 RepID=UPI002ACD2F38|nr:DNA polymerase III subunit delta' [Thiohalophilus sp.]MDZ7804987.1 DNA polymerase III subunit delta' [Thiohalophilus sp.]
MTIPVSQWHVNAWQQLQAGRRQQRLPHALLVSGEAGIGKAAFADRLAASLLCEQPREDGQACGTCPACQRLAAQTHPDRLRLEPEEPGKPIKVDMVRQLIQHLSLTGHYGGYRVVTVEPAEMMNTNAANAFLKTLEEPPASTLLILITASPARLPATIRSRCQPMRLTSPDPQTALAWLQQEAPDSAPQEAELALRLAAGAPRLAAHYLREGWLEVRQQLIEALIGCAHGRTDPLAAAATAQEALKLDRQLPIHWMYHWVADLIRLAYDENNIKNNDMTGELQALPTPVEYSALHHLLDKLQQARRLTETTINPQLLWEDLMIDWAGLFSARRV